MGIYRLPVGGEDHQHPHHADEIYIVQSGRGVLRVEGEDHPVGPGSVVSVDRGAEHNFTDIREDLTVMVLFAPPETPET
jgi:mannose-6-phosphate isomerase-like protein (cupin superfamily)